MSSIAKYRRTGSTTTVWRARITAPDGRRIQTNHATRADAELWVKEQTAALVRGDWADPRAGKVTFKAYAERWRADQLHHRPATVEQTRIRLTNHVYPTLGAMPIGSIKRSDIQRTINLAAQTLAPSTVEVVYAAITSVFKAAVLDRVVAVSPCAGIRLPAKPLRPRVVPLTVEQVHEIAERAGGPWRAMILLGAATGMRSGELRAVTADRLTPRLHLVGDLTPDHAVLTVDRSLTDALTFGPTKTAAAVRDLTLGPATVSLLRDHIATHGLGTDGLLFHIDGQPISRQRAGHMWRAATTGMTVRPRSGLHDLRHLAASSWLGAGASLASVSARLGHKTPTETLSAYAWAMPADDARMVAVSETVLYG
mgnify:CR=1 FL=1